MTGRMLILHMIQRDFLGSIKTLILLIRIRRVVAERQSGFKFAQDLGRNIRQRQNRNTLNHAR